jgi:hypothetical protein
MFISYMCVDENDKPLQRWVRVEGIDALNKYVIEFSSNHHADISPEQYDEIMAQLDALGLLYKPSEPMPPVGEPLREIVGGAFQEFMNTKGRTD